MERQEGGQIIQTIMRPIPRTDSPFVRPTAGEVAEEVTAEVNRLLTVVKGVMTRQELQKALGFKHEEHFRLAYLLPAITSGLLEMTVPDKPTSRLQRYKITTKGRAWLAARLIKEG